MCHAAAESQRAWVCNKQVRILQEARNAIIMPSYLSNSQGCKSVKRPFVHFKHETWQKVDYYSIGSHLRFDIYRQFAI